MKKITFAFLFFSLSSLSFSQENTATETYSEENKNNNSGLKALPKNGIEAFKNDFVKNLNLTPKKILEINQQQIRIILSFVVDETGNVSEIKIINDKYKLNDAVSEVFKKVEKWIPYQENGIHISSNNSLSIVLNLGLPDYELDENRVPKIALHKADFDAFYYEFNSHMIYPKDFWERYHFKKGVYDNGNKYASNELNYEVKFLINEKGEFEDIKTYVEDKYDPHLNKAVKRALNKCEPWEPAMLNGEKVKSRFILPIKLVKNKI